jgi:GNAT superfamily N-acetyltransferase
VEVVEYDPARAGELADLVGRVSGTRPDPDDLRWFYERNPVRPASVLLGVDDGLVVASVAITFVRMLLGREELEVGMPVRVATDPAYQGRGLFRRLQQANEERVEAMGIRLLLTVPNAASTPVFLRHLGWTALPALRLWGRPRLLPARRGAHEVERFAGAASAVSGEVNRDADWLNWRFADSPRPYTALEGDGYAAVGRRGPVATLGVVEGDLLREAVAAGSGHGVVAAPPRRDWARYARAGFVPTWKTLTLLGRSLDGRSLPERPHFQLGDLDFL